MRGFLRTILTILALAGPLLLAACLRQGEEAELRGAYDLLRAGEYEALKDRMIPEYRTAETLDTLRKLREEFVPVGEPEEVTRMGVNVLNSLGAGRSVSTVHRYVYPDRILDVTTVMILPPGEEDYLVQSLHINVAGGEFLETYQNKAARKAEAGD